VVINATNGAGESTVFSEVMLSATKASLIEVIYTSGEINGEEMDQTTLRWNRINARLYYKR